MSDPWRIIFRTTGGPEVLERETFDPGFPGPGQVRVKVSASGVNFIDTYHRAGLYPLPLPSGLGTEFAGGKGHHHGGIAIIHWHEPVPARARP